MTRSIIAAGLGAVGILLPAGYSSATCGAYHGPFGYTCAIFAFMVLVACLAVSGFVAAGVVRGWEGTVPLVTGEILGCAGFAVVSVIALGRPLDLVGTVQLALLGGLPLLAGYGIGRGLARFFAV